MNSGFWCLVGPYVAAIGQHLTTNAEAYGVGAVAFVLAAGRCMPKPGSPFSLLTFYTWLYDSVQSVLPIPRSSSTNPPPPVTPALPYPTQKL